MTDYKAHNLRDHTKIAEQLCDDVNLARARFVIASAVNQQKINMDLTELPNPEHSPVTRQPTQEYVEARNALMIALDRLNQFVLYHVIPDDLKTKKGQSA